MLSKALSGDSSVTLLASSSSVPSVVTVVDVDGVVVVLGVEM